MGCVMEQVKPETGTGKEIQVDDARTRQNLRAMGYREILRRIGEMFPHYDRREKKQVAKKLHQTAWQQRDVEAVDKLKKRVQT